MWIPHHYYYTTATNNTKMSRFHTSHLGVHTVYQTITHSGYANILHMKVTTCHLHKSTYIRTRPTQTTSTVNRESVPHMHAGYISTLSLHFSPPKTRKGVLQEQHLVQHYLPNVRSSKFKFHLQLPKKTPLGQETKGQGHIAQPFCTALAVGSMLAFKNHSWYVVCTARTRNDNLTAKTRKKGTHIGTYCLPTFQASLFLRCKFLSVVVKRKNKNQNMSWGIDEWYHLHIGCVSNKWFLSLLAFYETTFQTKGSALNPSCTQDHRKCSLQQFPDRQPVGPKW